MGAILSLAGTQNRTHPFDEVCSNGSCKRQKTSLSFDVDSPRLIPALPDELSIRILARIPRAYYFKLRLVSQKWKETIMGDELFELRKDLGLTEEWLYVLTKVEEELSWHALDPLTRKWQRLPQMPNVRADESGNSSAGLWLWNMVEKHIKLAEIIRNWLGHKQTFDHMPFCGCAIGAVNGCLYVLGGFFRASTINCVWRYDPILNRWSEVTPMSTGRAYCKTSILNDKLYVVGGVSQLGGGLIPLQSAEVFDPSTDTWSAVPSMPFSKSQQLPNAFWTDMLKPIATGMTSYMGRLCVPQSLYSWPFFVDAGGEIYDPETNSWSEMPTGMGEGWPARQAGTKLSVVVDGELYSLDPSSSRNSGKIKVYDHNEDAWKVAIGKVPIYDSGDSDSPHLLAGLHGKIHVVTKDASHRLTVMQAGFRDHFNSSARSSTSHFDDFSHEHLLGGSETVVWKVITSKDIGSAELVSCQVLDV